MTTDRPESSEALEELVIEHDEEARVWFVEAGTFGPAGGGVVEVLPGVSLFADIARPDRFCRLELDADDPDAPLDASVLDAVTRLAGADVARVLRQPPTEPMRLERSRDSAITGRGRHVPPNRASRAAALAGLAASDPDEPLWELEHAHVASVSGWHHLAREATRDLRGVAERLLEASAAATGGVALSAQDQRRAEELLAWLARQLDAVDPDLARRVVVEGLALLARPSATSDHMLTAAEPAWRREPGSADVEVLLGSADDRQWVCAFDGNLLVAIAPVVDAAAGKRAQLYVPPSVSDDRLRLVATDDPTEGANSPGLLAFLASTAAGRHAAQLERLGRFADAASAWDECAELWASEGDDVRVRLAHSYAYAARARAGERQGRDHDIDQVEVERPVPHPYLGDVVTSR